MLECLIVSENELGLILGTEWEQYVKGIGYWQVNEQYKDISLSSS